VKAFNAFFVSQSLIILTGLVLSGLLSQRTTSLGTVVFNLWMLNVYMSMGPDGIHPRVVKELAHIMAEPS